MPDGWGNGFLKAVVPTNARAFLKGVTGSTTPADNDFFTDEDILALRRAASNIYAGERKDLTQDETFIANNPDYKDMGARHDQRVNALIADPNFKGPLPTMDEPSTMAAYLASKGEDYPTKVAAALRNLDANATDPYSTIMSYDAYQGLRGEPKDVSGILDTFTDPLYRMKTTIGGAMLERTPDGDVILTDQYNFNKNSMPVSSRDSLYGKLHAFGESIIGASDGTEDLQTWTPETRRNEKAGFPIRVNLGKWGKDVKAE